MAYNRLAALALGLVASCASLACGDDKAPHGTTPDALGDTTTPDTTDAETPHNALTPCLEAPGELARPPGVSLPCALIPPTMD